MQLINNVLSNQELTNILSNIDVINNYNKLIEKKTNKILFYIDLTTNLKLELESKFNLTLTQQKIPLCWFNGDTEAHIDRQINNTNFDYTYIIYLSQNAGTMVIDNTNYEINYNSGFKFYKDSIHATINTNPRLTIGPMNINSNPVGMNFIQYYESEADAIAGNNSIGATIYNGPGTYIIGNLSSGTINGISSWRIANTSSGTSPYFGVYNNGAELNPDGIYYLYPNITCIRRGTKILCKIYNDEKYINIEDIYPGTLVKIDDKQEYKLFIVYKIGSNKIKTINNLDRIQNRIYKLSMQNYPELNDDLYITGCHALLKTTLTEQEQKDMITHFGKIYITGKKYRFMTYLDNKAEPYIADHEYEEIWHLALDSDDKNINYGIYANGLLIETCSINFINNKSNLKFK